jgi:hypothetical protein
MPSKARTDPVFFPEALERLLPLPQFDNNPHKVASWLDDRHRDGDLQLLAGDIVIAPAANPSMLGVVAHIPQVGKAVLYIQVRKSMNIDCPLWDCESETGLLKHQGYWSYGRTTFEEVFPVSVDRGGRPPEYSREDILIEAAILVYEDGPPERLTAGAWADAISARIEARGANSPGSTLLREVLGPLNKRFKAIVPKR